jgi:outer membrane protein OmpA-like peptidoglycan-associated protein
MPTSLPTGDDMALRGAGGVTLHPELLLAAHFGRIGLGLDVGYHWRSQHPPLPYADSISLGPWFSLGLTEQLNLRVEMFAEKHINTEMAGADFPIELLGGLEFAVTPSWRLYGGASFGLTDGIGDPDFRIIAGVRYRSTPTGKDDDRGHPEDQGFRDSDDDEVQDKDDKEPYEPEDQDGFEDDDGRPDPDNDHDGIPDSDDECPELEGDREHDGCPAKTYVKIENGKIIIFGKVQFRTGSAEIDHRSEPLLDQIGQALNANPDVKHVEIQGHTDNVGGRPINQKLSEERAASVKSALEKRNVDGGRLEPHGYGENRPIAPNKSPGGRAKNRRVEFVIRR